MKKFPALRLTTVEATSSDTLFSATTFFTRPWHILQWMKDPETWLLNLTRLQLHPAQFNKYHRRRRDIPPFRPDPLLFPSTWPPLHILSGMAMVHAIAQTLPMKTGANTRILMQDFCLAVTILDEWKRVFLYERRITLGVVWSALSFAAFFVLAFSAAIEVGWVSAALLLPIGFACLVSGWMNTVLYSERYVQNIQSRR
jgi:tryptophan-rich sensory protein